MSLKENKNILPAAILSVGILALGFCLKGGIDDFVNKDRTVEVRGLAEREVKADKVTWPIQIKETGNDLKELYGTINRKKAVIRQFLVANGLNAADFSTNAPKVEDFITQGSYQQDVRYRYTITLTMTVVSKNVELVRQLIDRQGELLDQGVAIIAREDWQGSGVTYEYTQFKQLKPKMVKEAIENAQETANQFAENYGSDLGKIVTADQGQFEIDDRDDNTPYIKNVRVVTHITYELK